MRHGDRRTRTRSLCLLRFGSCPLVLLCIATSARAGEEGPYAKGALAWFSSDRYELIGTIATEIPLASPGAWRVFVGASALTAIEGAEDFTFTVGQVDYALRFGARRRAFEVFAGEQGVQAVDTAGRARVREIGGAWASHGFHDAFPRDGWAGRIALGAVVSSHGVDAAATASGAVRFAHRLGEAQRGAIAVEASADALAGGDHGVDWTAGPRLDLHLGGDRRFGLYVRWLSSEHPLGLGAEGLLAGFDLAQGPVAAGPRPTPPEIRGWLSAGGGDGGRGTAGVDLRVDSPPFLGGAYGEIEVEANVLSGEDVNDLYYVYDAGIAHPLRERWRVGGWFHHRSGHVLDASASVTSLNVLEAGIETSGWRAAEPGVDLGRAGAIDLSARAGWLLDSSFTDGVSWHARGGLRWATPPWRGARLYTLAAAERGGAEGSRYGIGALLPRGWDVRVEAGHDEQLQSADDRGIFAIATLGF